ncbi:LOW QUALITY PROTEIN: TIMELESS-interacting protein-like [Apodemus sylvaticus]|uniref:LOW QUALITY PROTEIN: TIMELESS-interacting protein-like n=1 Tax=Apodemus sylvaticus TaxID=10129 RepID=UPI002244E1EE|nr:LOW QUALITY PROTEIN: TIMELESS-interacting protein-like [Apodemus sylvaticus]
MSPPKPTTSIVMFPNGITWKKLQTKNWDPWRRISQLLSRSEVLSLPRREALLVRVAAPFGIPDSTQLQKLSAVSRIPASPPTAVRGQHKKIEQEENGLFEIPDCEALQRMKLILPCHPNPPPPTPASPERDPAEAEADEGSGGGIRVPPKRTVKSNLPKLDAARSTSERGLPALRRVFDKTKFKGKGHEAEDLKTLMRHVEPWAHRTLFPKLQFEDFIDRVENLGNKKAVQTCLKRTGLDLPIVHEDFVNDEVEDTNSLDVTATESDPFLTSASNSRKFASESTGSLTEEQQQRIEGNEQLVLERRQVMLRRSNSQSLESDGTVEETRTGEDQEESNGLNRDTADGPHDVPSASTHEEEQLNAEETQLETLT